MVFTVSTGRRPLNAGIRRTGGCRKVLMDEVGDARRNVRGNVIISITGERPVQGYTVTAICMHMHHSGFVYHRAEMRW